MASFDITKVVELVQDVGVPVMLESYGRHTPIYPQLCEVVPIGPRNRLGQKGTVVTGMGRLQEREPGAKIEYDEPRKALDWYLKTHFFDRAFSIPVEQLEASDGYGKLGDMISQFADTWGEVAAIQKDDEVADVLQKGTLTAGSARYFDGSHPGYADPYPTVIYDNLPFFDTAHTQAIGGNTFSNHLTGTALTLANLETAWIRMTSTNAYDDRNERVIIRPNTLIVPPGLQFTAQVLLESLLKPGTSQNDVNTFGGKLDLIVYPHLDDAASASAWWMAERGRGLQFNDGGEPTMRAWYNEADRTVHVAVHAEWGVAVKNWRYWLNANKAAA